MGDENKKAISNLNPVQVLYYNGFVMNFNPTDIQLTIYLNGSPQVNLITSPVTFKNLAKNMLLAVEDYEKLLGTKIEEFSDIESKFRAKENE